MTSAPATSRPKRRWSASLGIRDDEPTELLQAQFDDLDGILDTTSRVMLGMSMGTMGFIFALSAMNQVSSLQKQLKEAGLLPEESEAE